jgi:putative RNA 2'-phosphotransferase
MPTDPAGVSQLPVRRRTGKTGAVDRAVVISKRLAYWLRHRPDAAGLTLDAHGWVPVADVLAALGRSGLPVDRDQLDAVVAGDDKQRYAIAGDRIRASQGHTVAVDLELAVTPPPPTLWHGTSRRFLDRILAEGLHPRGRHHVHLSGDPATATRVAARRPPSVILTVAAGRMAADGHQFRRSANGVWLVDHVPPAYLGESA